MPYRYVNSGEDSARWTGFPFRDGDIVISTRSKSGTTWVQMICAVLVLGTPDLPRPLGERLTIRGPRGEQGIQAPR